MLCESEERLMVYYDRIVGWVKSVINDDVLSSEEKIRLLGMVL